jgi:hypothetical protein
MSCQNGACKCGFLQSASRGCNKDDDCDCKLDWKLLVFAIVGGVFGLALLIWGVLEQSRANREGAELAQLIRKAAAR